MNTIVVCHKMYNFDYADCSYSSTNQKNWIPDQVGLDRFVPPRRFRPHLPLWSVGDLINSVEEAENAPRLNNIFRQCHSKEMRRAEYRRLLTKTMFRDIDSFGNRVLPFWRSGTGLRPRKAIVFEVEFRTSWPLYKRPFPLVGKPYRTVVLPYLPSSSLSSQPLAWGECDMLAAAVGSSVSVWREGMGCDPGAKLDVPNDEVVSVAWKHSQRTACLAIGTRRAFLQVWDCAEYRKVAERLSKDHKTPCALAWHPAETDLFVAGSASGTLTVYSSCLTKAVAPHPAIHVRVTQLSFNSDGSMLLSGGTEGCTVLWRWPEFTPIMEFNNHSSIMALSWHPWRKIAAVGSLYGHIVQIDLNNMKTIEGQYATTDGPSVLTSLSFSPRTAELVTAFRAGSNQNSGSFGERSSEIQGTHLVVLADFTRAVDRMEKHEVPVRCLQWSPDGAILASLGADRTLCLWNFFGEDGSKKIRKQVALEARENRVGVNRQFGCVIR